MAKKKRAEEELARKLERESALVRAYEAVWELLELYGVEPDLDDDEMFRNARGKLVTADDEKNQEIRDFMRAYTLLRKHGYRDHDP